MGTIHASTPGSPRQPSRSLCAWTACPPRIRREATTMATLTASTWLGAGGGGGESCIWQSWLGFYWAARHTPLTGLRERRQFSDDGRRESGERLRRWRL